MRTREIDATAVQTLLAAAVAAPSIHNTQPWRFGLDADTRTVEFRAVAGRRLPMTDPDLRARHISVGAAVFNLRVAAAHLGWRPVVRLLPAADDPDLLATVHLAGGGEDGPPSLRPLYEAVERRHSSRMPFTGRPVPEAIVTEMITAAHTQGARLEVPDIVRTSRLLRLTQAGEVRNASHPGRTAEAHRWLTAPGLDSGYGIPVTAVGALDASGRIPMRDFTGQLPVPHLPALHFERHTQVALLWTARDRHQDWLRAGQALQHVLLTATSYGLRTSMLHQAMEWMDLRAAVSGSQQRCPQLLIRFGYGPEGSRTPRAAAYAASPRPAVSGGRAAPPG
ncbi:hypothetical protein C6W96_03295 [Streptomyces sp. CS149]|uniref:Acg family FMN-binding oxidoreductase n=1 Tax=Streptomyces TaxID=1883 RepID=UPI00067BE48E|nr:MULTISPECIES: aromatic ring-opening dioxygenase LigA [Streptomyces]MDX3605550.1 hypothetical protein [Streptomyces sp. FL06-04B]MDX3735702.1 hypothetical protein [Streptomyces sp. ID01-15D]PSK73905.1 hypothetical protein C6W96_03295 [Streptomyces sp. CS149]